MPWLDADVDADHVGRVRAQAQELLNTIQVQFGIEGLAALERCKHRPGQVTPQQQAIASHIRSELGPEVFWLGEALTLWRRNSTEG